MGVAASAPPRAPQVDRARVRAAQSRFDAHELAVLKSTFRDLAERSPSASGIDRATFLRVFPLPGLLGERLFDAFDSKREGTVDWEEFVTGFAACIRGSLEEKLRFLFYMFDLSNDGSVTREELRTLLHHLPRALLQAFHSRASDAAADAEAEALSSGWNPALVDRIVARAFNDTLHAGEGDEEGQGAGAGAAAASEATERLDFDQFSAWLLAHPEVMFYLHSFFPLEPSNHDEGGGGSGSGGGGVAAGSSASNSAGVAVVPPGCASCCWGLWRGGRQRPLRPGPRRARRGGDDGSSNAGATVMGMPIADDGSGDVAGGGDSGSVDDGGGGGGDGSSGPPSSAPSFHHHHGHAASRPHSLARRSLAGVRVNEGADGPVFTLPLPLGGGATPPLQRVPSGFTPAGGGEGEGGSASAPGETLHFPFGHAAGPDVEPFELEALPCGLPLDALEALHLHLQALEAEQEAEEAEEAAAATAAAVVAAGASASPVAADVPPLPPSADGDTVLVTFFGLTCHTCGFIVRYDPSSGSRFSDSNSSAVFRAGGGAARPHWIVRVTPGQRPGAPPPAPAPLSLHVRPLSLPPSPYLDGHHRSRRLSAGAFSASGSLLSRDYGNDLDPFDHDFATVATLGRDSTLAEGLAAAGGGSGGGQEASPSRRRASSTLLSPGGGRVTASTDAGSEGRARLLLSPPSAQRRRASGGPAPGTIQSEHAGCPSCGAARTATDWQPWDTERQPRASPAAPSGSTGGEDGWRASLPFARHSTADACDGSLLSIEGSPLLAPAAGSPFSSVSAGPPPLGSGFLDGFSLAAAGGDGGGGGTRSGAGVRGATADGTGRSHSTASGDALGGGGGGPMLRVDDDEEEEVEEGEAAEDGDDAVSLSRSQRWKRHVRHELELAAETETVAAAAADTPAPAPAPEVESSSSYPSASPTDAVDAMVANALGLQCVDDLRYDTLLILDGGTGQDGGGEEGGSGATGGGEEAGDAGVSASPPPPPPGSDGETSEAGALSASASIGADLAAAADSAASARGGGGERKALGPGASSSSSHARRSRVLALRIRTGHHHQGGGSASETDPSPDAAAAAAAAAERAGLRRVPSASSSGAGGGGGESATASSRSASPLAPPRRSGSVTSSSRRPVVSTTAAATTAAFSGSGSSTPATTSHHAGGAHHHHHAPLPYSSMTFAAGVAVTATLYQALDGGMSQHHHHQSLRGGQHGHGHGPPLRRRPSDGGASSGRGIARGESSGGLAASGAGAVTTSDGGGGGLSASSSSLPAAAAAVVAAAGDDGATGVAPPPAALPASAAAGAQPRHEKSTPALPRAAHGPAGPDGYDEDDEEEEDDDDDDTSGGDSPLPAASSHGAGFVRYPRPRSSSDAVPDAGVEDAALGLRFAFLSPEAAAASLADDELTGSLALGGAAGGDDGGDGGGDGGIAAWHEESHAELSAIAAALEPSSFVDLLGGYGGAAAPAPPQAQQQPPPLPGLSTSTTGPGYAVKLVPVSPSLGAATTGGAAPLFLSGPPTQSTGAAAAAVPLAAPAAPPAPPSAASRFRPGLRPKPAPAGAAASGKSGSRRQPPSVRGSGGAAPTTAGAPTSSGGVLGGAAARAWAMLSSLVSSNSSRGNGSGSAGGSGARLPRGKGGASPPAAALSGGGGGASASSTAQAAAAPGTADDTVAGGAAATTEGAAAAADSGGAITAPRASSAAAAPSPSSSHMPLFDPTALAVMHPNATVSGVTWTHYAALLAGSLPDAGSGSGGGGGPAGAGAVSRPSASIGASASRALRGKLTNNGNTSSGVARQTVLGTLTSRGSSGALAPAPADAAFSLRAFADMTPSAIRANAGLQSVGVGDASTAVAEGGVDAAPPLVVDADAAAVSTSRPAPSSGWSTPQGPRGTTGPLTPSLDATAGTALGPRFAASGGSATVVAATPALVPRGWAPSQPLPPAVDTFRLGSAAAPATASAPATQSGGVMGGSAPTRLLPPPPAAPRPPAATDPSLPLSALRHHPSVSLGAGAARVCAATGGLLEHEGYLCKVGQRLRTYRRRWYYLQQNFLYWYSTQAEGQPRGVLFLEGSTPLPLDDPATEARGFFGLCIHTSSAHGDRVRLLYATSRAERDEWLSVLRVACASTRFNDEYEIGPQLGEGRFARVFLATRRATGERFAVKVINKATLGESERELLRTEIAILRLVAHPHVVRLENVYEDAATLYIVMELVEGGELFSRIVGRARFRESETRSLIRPLLEAVSYLHALGVSHRDIKPENILTGARLQDVRIADFGLSKLVHPGEVMTLPCGSLNYCAPEVLSRQPYGREADLWSLGVIAYLVTRGRLPFDGPDKESIIRQTLEAKLDFTHPVWETWSPQGLAFIKGLLERDPSKRLSARAALAHPWMRLPAEAEGGGGGEA